MVGAKYYTINYRIMQVSLSNKCTVRAGALV